MLRSWPAVAGVVFLALMLISCGGAGQPGDAGKKARPRLPVSTAFRNSLVGKGKVLLIRNDSTDETLPALVVRVRTAKWGDNSEQYREVGKDVKPGQVVEVGWQQLRGWRLEAGEEVEISCVGGKDYDTLTVRVPEKPSN
jgi:hypothetical protein